MTISLAGNAYIKKLQAVAKLPLSTIVTSAMHLLLTFALFMFRKKQSLRIFLSALLLLSFSVTVLPLDFLHNHENTAECRQKAQSGTCHHKFHISQKSSFCWLCAVHYDKAFTALDIREQLASLPVFSYFSESRILTYVSEVILTTLRGPPSQ